MRPVPTPVSTDRGSGAADMDSRFNELRSEWLDHREKIVDWWLTATSLFLTLLSVLVIVAGYVGIKRFNEIETEARRNVKLAEEHAENATRRDFNKKEAP